VRRSLLAVLVLGMTMISHGQTLAPDTTSGQTGIAGIWRAEPGSGVIWAALLRATGDRITGVVNNCAGPGPIPEIENADFDGKTLTFTCTSHNGRTVSFIGSVNGNEIAFTWDLRVHEGAEPVPADFPVFSPSAPRQFIAKRSADTGIAALDAALKDAVEHVRVPPSVPFDRIMHAAQEPQNWLTYSGTLDGHRHSLLTQITPDNVTNLGLAWLWQAQPNDRFVATPLVVDGVMYTVEAPNTVIALDAATGRVFWKYTYTASVPGIVCCGRVNRGLGILDDTLFMGTLDAHLVAIDAYTGKPRWNTSVADPKDPACNTGVCYAIVHAPLIAKDKVVVGVAGGDNYAGGGMRGFVAAFDARTGKEQWRFHTIPQPGESGHETWSGDPWKIGGGGVWNSGAYDPELNLTYWGVGNPSPVVNGANSSGDELYTESVVALNADTGALTWHYQFTPHDDNDMDSAQIPVLADIQWQGRQRKAMLWANKNGLLYALDRATGQFLMGKPLGEVNWMDGFDEKGRPILAAKEGISRTSTNWQPPSFSPRTGLFYVAISQPTKEFRGSMYGAIRAFDPETGSQVWEFRKPNAQFSAGVLTTASDLLFTGCGDPWSIPRQFDCELVALSARNGQLLWQFALPGSTQSGAMSYSVRGKQYIAVTASNTLFAFTLRQ